MKQQFSPKKDRGGITPDIQTVLAYWPTMTNYSTVWQRQKMRLLSKKDKSLQIPGFAKPK